MEKPIVVAHIVGKWLGGGVEAVIMNYYRNIDRNKVQFDFICDSDSTNIPYDEIESLGGRVILVPPYQKLFKYKKELKRIFKENNYQIVHSHINTLSVFPLSVAKKVGIPIRIAHSHSTSNKKEWKKNLLKNVLKPFSKKYATEYFSCSELAGRWLFKNKTFDKGEVIVINNAIDLDKFKYDEEIRNTKRNELGIKPDTFVVGHIGRFVKQKNHEFLIDIFKEIKKKNDNSMLLMAGQGPLMDEIKEKVKNLGLEDSIKFLGQRNDVNELYQAFDLFLLPSLYEGLPVVGVEAQASGNLCFLSNDMTKETKVLDSTRFMSLDSSPEQWADEILKAKEIYKKHDTTEEVSKYGFNIKLEAKKLENRYYDLLYPNSKKRITITNAYTWYNKGDAGILLGIVDTLKKKYNNNVSFDVLSFTPVEDRKRYCEDNKIKNIYSNVLNPHPYKHTKYGKIKAIIKLVFSMIYQLLFIKILPKRLINKNKNYNSLNKCDYIIVCGGGFLGGNKFNSFMHLFQIYINTKFNKKVIIMGASIEPVTNRFVKRITEKVLKKVDYIYAREIITYNYLKEFINDEKFELIPDMAFMLNDIKVPINKIKNWKNDHKYIYGITVRKWDFPGEKNSVELFENYKIELEKFIEYKILEDNSLFVFVPQVIVSHDNDIEVAKQIKEMLPNNIKNNFIIIEYDLHPDEIKRLIWNFDYFIGTRMHSNIFATSMLVPTIAIAYEKKTNGIMHTVELDDYVIEMKELSYDKLKELSIKQIENDEQLRVNLNKKIEEIRKEIEKRIYNRIDEV